MAINSPGIVKAANDALVAVRPAINVVKSFAYDMSDEFASAGDTVKVPVASTGALSAFDASTNNFENGDGSLTWESVTLSDTVKATFAVTSKNMLDMPMDSYWEVVAQAAASSVGKYISDKIGGLFNTTDLTSTYALSGELTLKKAAKLRAQAKGRVDESVLIVKPDWYSDLIGELTNSVYGGIQAVQDGKVEKLAGYAAVVEGRSLPSGVNGVILPKDCLVIASRAFAVADESVYTEYGTQRDEETGFAMTAMRHGDPSTGGAFVNIAAMFGVKLVQKDKIVLIKNA